MLLFTLTLIASGVIFPECKVGSSTSMLQVNMGVSQNYQNWTLVYSVSGNFSFLKALLQTVLFLSGSKNSHEHFYAKKFFKHFKNVKLIQYFLGFFISSTMK